MTILLNSNQNWQQSYKTHSNTTNNRKRFSKKKKLKKIPHSSSRSKPTVYARYKRLYVQNAHASDGIVTMPCYDQYTIHDNHTRSTVFVF